jgi:hypothetical protein
VQRATQFALKDIRRIHILKPSNKRQINVAFADVVQLQMVLSRSKTVPTTISASSPLGFAEPKSGAAPHGGEADHAAMAGDEDAAITLIEGNEGAHCRPNHLGCGTFSHLCTRRITGLPA